MQEGSKEKQDRQRSLCKITKRRVQQIIFFQHPFQVSPPFYYFYLVQLPMNTVIASIGKNLILLALLLVSVINVFAGAMTFKTLIAVQIATGFVYVFLSCYEYLNASYKAALPLKRFPYFSYSVIMFKVLKSAVFLTFAVVLYFAQDRFRMLYPICLVIAITEAIITWLRYRNSMFFVNIYANYLLMVDDKINKLFASDILLVEFRHEIFYFIKKDHKTFTLKLEHLSEKELFTRNLYDWIKRNQVTLSEESAKKITDRIV